MDGHCEGRSRPARPLVILRKLFFSCSRINVPSCPPSRPRACCGNPRGGKIAADHPRGQGVKVLAGQGSSVHLSACPPAAIVHGHDGPAPASGRQGSLRCQQREQAAADPALDVVPTVLLPARCAADPPCASPHADKGTQFPSFPPRVAGALGSFLPEAGRLRGVCEWPRAGPGQRQQQNQSLRRWKTALRKRMKTQGSRMGLKALKRKARRSPISLLSGVMACVKPRI